MRYEDRCYYHDHTNSWNSKQPTTLTEVEGCNECWRRCLTKMIERGEVLEPKEMMKALKCAFEYIYELDDRTSPKYDSWG